MNVFFFAVVKEVVVVVLSLTLGSGLARVRLIEGGAEWFQTCISVTVYFLSTTVGTLRNTHCLLQWASYVTPPSITVGSVT